MTDTSLDQPETIRHCKRAVTTDRGTRARCGGVLSRDVCLSCGRAARPPRCSECGGDIYDSCCELCGQFHF